MTVSDNHSFQKHPFSVAICIFNFNIQQNKQDATNISTNERKTDDIYDGYHCVYLPLSTFLHLHLSPPLLTFFLDLFYHSVFQVST